MAETWGRSWPVDEMAEIQEVDPPPPHQDTGETLVAIQSWEGPLPAPETLERFEAVVPGSAKTIIAEWQAETRHRRKFEHRSCLLFCLHLPPLLSQVMQQVLVPHGLQELLEAEQLQVLSGLWFRATATSPPSQPARSPSAIGLSTYSGMNR